MTKTQALKEARDHLRYGHFYQASPVRRWQKCSYCGEQIAAAWPHTEKDLRESFVLHLQEWH